MPTVLREGSLRFFFYSNEGSEPPHVHVEDLARSITAKFCLAPVRLVGSSGYRSRQWRRAHWLVIQHRLNFLQAWHDYFPTP